MVGARLRVPLPVMAPDKLILPSEISAETVPPELITIGVVSVGVVEFATPLDNTRVPELTVVVPV